MGGGVMGASIAFHLAEAGVRDVLLLERDELASGSTSRAAGGVRAQFSDELNIRIALRSLEAFRAFEERPGWDIGLHQVGYLFLLTREEDVERFRGDIALQNALGVPSELLTPDEVAARCPLVVTDDVLAGAFCALDGHATPEAVVQGYATGARAHGATLVTHCAVEGVEVDGGEVRAVRAGGQRVETQAVVCAAGAWSRVVAALAGVDLPVEPLRRQVLTTGPMPGLDPRTPITIDFATSFYFHGEGPGLLLGMSDPDETPGFKLTESDAWLAGLGAAIERRAPALGEVGLGPGWAGLYEMTPDHNALVGEAEGVSRFLYAAGFSGHGFLMGPAIGEVMRDLYLGRSPVVDVSPLTAGRFADAGLRPELNIV